MIKCGLHFQLHDQNEISLKVSLKNKIQTTTGIAKGDFFKFWNVEHEWDMSSTSTTLWIKQCEKFNFFMPHNFWPWSLFYRNQKMSSML